MSKHKGKKKQKAPDQRNEGFKAKDAMYEHNVEKTQLINKQIITKVGLTDYTDKEIEQKAGPVYAYNFNARIPIEEFRSMSLQNKKEYIEHLKKKYDGLRIVDLAAMFGVSSGSLATLLHDLRIDFPKGGARYMSAGRERFYEEMVPSDEEGEVKVKEPDLSSVSFEMERASFVCKAENVCEVLSMLGFNGRTLRIIAEPVGGKEVV
jgi:hypothetical protein